MKQKMLSVLRRCHACLHQPDWHMTAGTALLALVLCLALELRLQSVLGSTVVSPVRADAREYILYAHNLQHYGVYSRSDTLAPIPTGAPTPDAKRTPIYPMFLALLLSNPPTLADITTITLAQALLSTLTVFLAFLLARLVLPRPLALVPATLVALSPHLVAMNIYVLSETLFTLLVTSALYLVAKADRHRTIARASLAGFVLAIAALTHPMFMFLIVPLAAFLFLRWRGARGRREVIAFLSLFSLVFGAWIARNELALGASGDRTLMLAALRTGVYRNLMYQDDPKTFAYPYRADPTFEKTSRDVNAVLTVVAQEFSEAPWAQLRWYLIGKPALLWSWDNAEGPGDVFVYPVTESPYLDRPHFRITHDLMQALHQGLVVLMVLGVLLVWVPRSITDLPESAAFGARVLSLTLIYHTVVMVAGFPLPRYSIPMRPVMYVMAMVPFLLAGSLLKRFLQRKLPGHKFP